MTNQLNIDYRLELNNKLVKNLNQVKKLQTRLNYLFAQTNKTDNPLLQIKYLVYPNLDNTQFELIVPITTSKFKSKKIFFF
jgi:hypothetical protein